jgi:hypothetical protein
VSLAGEAARHVPADNSARDQKIYIRLFKIGFTLALCLSMPDVRGATLELTTPLDANANDTNLDGIWDSLSLGPKASLLAYNGGASYNYRAGMEFDIRGLEQPLPSPQYVAIESATLLVKYQGGAGDPALTMQFSKFDGDGQLTLGDFQLRDPIGPRMNSGNPAPDSLYRVPVTDFIQSLIQRRVPYAGFFAENLAVRQTELGGYYALFPPTLSITYSILPEPTCVSAIGVLACLAATRRRARSAGSREGSVKTSKAEI